MNDIDEMLNDSAVRFFTDLCSRDVLDQVEQGKWLPASWSDMKDLGLVGAAVMPLDDEVEGLPLASLCTLARQAGRFNLPLPLVETFIAQRALRRSGIGFADDEAIGMSTLAEQKPVHLEKRDGGYTATGVLHSVAWGRHCGNVLAPARLEGRPCLALIPRPESVEHRLNLAGEPRDRIRFDAVALAQEQVAVLDTADILDDLVFEGALFRAMQISGAMQQVLRMTIDYAKEREQFGRAIAKFQAIQQQIAEQAGQTASATAAADAAAHASAQRVACVEAAMAKIRASEAATLSCTIAHQVHGAMGFTHEHALHLSSRRLLAWRDEFGSDGYWADWLGRRLVSITGASLWESVTNPSFLLSPEA
ncbi:MAG: acyl-CoA dehydrogenase family protein [Burkholderiaceae bacterium]